MYRVLLHGIWRIENRRYGLPYHDQNQELDQIHMSLGHSPSEVTSLTTRALLSKAKDMIAIHSVLKPVSATIIRGSVVHD